MKSIIFALVLLSGCAVKNTPTVAFDGTANRVSMNQQIALHQKNAKELNLLLAEFPAKTFDVEMQPLQIVSQVGNQVTVNVLVKSNFKTPWLIALWQNLYSLGDPEGTTSQISVQTMYDINGPDHWNTSRFVRGTVKYIGRDVYDIVARNMLDSNPTVQLTFINAKNQAIYTRRVDMPALTHSYVDQSTPVFVARGRRADMRPINLDWPVAPLQIRILGDQVVWMTGQITLDSGMLAQTSRVHAQIVRQN